MSYLNLCSLISAHVPELTWLSWLIKHGLKVIQETGQNQAFPSINTYQIIFPLQIESFTTSPVRCVRTTPVGNITGFMLVTGVPAFSRWVWVLSVIQSFLYSLAFFNFMRKLYQGRVHLYVHVISYTCLIPNYYA